MWAPKFSTWKKQGDVLRTSGITLPLGFQGSPTLISNTYTTWKCPEISHSEENVCCVWIILSFSCRCDGQCSWWGCGRITANHCPHFTLDGLCWLSSKFFLYFLFCRACWLFLTNKKKKPRSCIISWSACLPEPLPSTKAFSLESESLKNKHLP